MGEKGAEAGAYRLGTTSEFPSFEGSAGAQTVLNNPAEPTVAGSQGAGDTPDPWLQAANDGPVYSPIRQPAVGSVTKPTGELGAEDGSAVSGLEPFSYDTALMGWDKTSGTPGGG